LNELISAFSDAIEYYSGLAREGWTLDGEIDGGRVLLTNPEIASLREALYERMKQLGTGAE
jgi:hypothetical protein